VGRDVSATDGPVFTVVIPTWNRAELLARALESVLIQTLDRIEVFVSDNGSTDHTADVVRSFDDARITYAPLPENLGLHANLNRCLQFGSAPYLAYLHDDDWFHPTNLERKAAFLDDHPTVGAVHSPVDRADADGHIYRRNVVFGSDASAGVERGAAFIERSMHKMGLMDFSATALRRSSLGALRFRPEDGFLCDVAFRLRMALGSDVGFIDEPLTVQTKHEMSQSRTGGVEREAETGEGAPSVAHVRELWRLKEEFIQEHALELQDPERLRQIALHSTRRQFMSVARSNMLLEPSLTSRFGMLSQVLRADPKIVLTGGGARLVTLAALGPKGRRVLQSVRRTSR
jgi:hypothetical protein